MPETSTTSTNGPEALSLTCGNGDGGLGAVVAVGGELDMATVPQLEGALRDTDADGGRFVLDLGGLDFMDCAGAHLLVDSDRRLRQAGRKLFVVVADRGPVERLLALLGLSDQLELVKQPPQARPGESLGSDGGALEIGRL